MICAECNAHQDYMFEEFTFGTLQVVIIPIMNYESYQVGEILFIQSLVRPYSSSGSSATSSLDRCHKYLTPFLPSLPTVVSKFPLSIPCPPQVSSSIARHEQCISLPTLPRASSSGYPIILAVGLQLAQLTRRHGHQRPSNSRWGFRKYLGGNTR